MSHFTQIINNETGQPVEGITAGIGFLGCHGLIMGCITGYDFSTDEGGKSSITMPYGEFEKEKNISRYVLSVMLHDEAGNYVHHQLVSCGSYDDCSSFLAGKSMCLSIGLSCCRG